MSEEEKSRSKMWIIGVNMLVLIAYSILIRLGAKGQEADLGVLLGAAFFITIHIVVCLIVSIFAYRKEFLLSALAVLLIGFSTCVFIISK